MQQVLYSVIYICNIYIYDKEKHRNIYIYCILYDEVTLIILQMRSLELRKEKPKVNG